MQWNSAFKFLIPIYPLQSKLFRTNRKLFPDKCCERGANFIECSSCMSFPVVIEATFNMQWFCLNSLVKAFDLFTAQLNILLCFVTLQSPMDNVRLTVRAALDNPRDCCFLLSALVCQLFVSSPLLLSYSARNVQWALFNVLVWSLLLIIFVLYESIFNSLDR